jgi:hypothetical protein
MPKLVSYRRLITGAGPEEKRSSPMIRKILAILAVTLLTVGLALAAEDCAQAFKDTTAKFKTSTIDAGAIALVGDIIGKDEGLCQGDAAQQGQAIELLRSARMMIGE